MKRTRGESDADENYMKGIRGELVDENQRIVR